MAYDDDITNELSMTKLCLLNQVILEPAEKCSYRSIKKGNMFKAKTLIEKGGTRNLNQLP